MKCWQRRLGQTLNRFAVTLWRSAVAPLFLVGALLGPRAATVYASDGIVN